MGAGVGSGLSTSFVVGEEWAQKWVGGLVPPFNIYISHVKHFTSKINEEGEGSVICFCFLNFL